MGHSFSPTGHYTITQLDYFGNANYLLGMVALIGQQHQEEEYIRNDGFRFPVMLMDNELKRILSA